MELVKRVEECVVTTNRGDRFDMQFGVETDLKDQSRAFSYSDLEPVIRFNCLDCETQIGIGEFSLHEPRLSINPWGEIYKDFIEFIKFIAKRLEFELTTNGGGICYAEASKGVVLFHSKTYIPNIYYTKCPHCGSQYLMFYSFSGGGQDRCPVTLTIDCIWQVHLDDAFAQKYLTV
ncbi:hypothetical protein [Alistipes sp. ZOR0009]|uniref:hypothetical protein n=1 Tax=Alistipes sp. ZOR0009 TaxID=1339253 RepID=UPI000647BCE0|nr:hypothetical protein [Alistipes sp. ZOR0009]